MEIPVNHHEILGSSDEIPNFCKETSPWILFVSSLLVGRHSPFQLIICYASPFLATNQPVSWYHPSFVGPLSNKVGMIYIYMGINPNSISNCGINWNILCQNIQCQIIQYNYILCIYILGIIQCINPRISYVRGFPYPDAKMGGTVVSERGQIIGVFQKKWFSFAHKTARASLSIEYPLVN
jgi:hypothetical protein